MRLLFYVILLTPLISFIDNIIGRGILQYLMLFIPTLVLIERKLYKNILVILTYLIFIAQLSINIFLSNENFNYITLVRWTGFMLILILCCDKEIIGNFLGFIKEKYNFIKGLSIFYLGLEIYYFFFDGFTYNWDGKYFVSFYTKNDNFGGAAAHTNSYLLIIIQLMLMYIVHQEIKSKNTKKIIIYSITTIIALYFNLLTGARTSSVIALFMLGCYILRALYDNRHILKKHVKSITIIVIGISLLSGLLIAFDIVNLESIPLVQKFMRQVNNGNFMSSRDRIWPALLAAFSNDYSIFEMFFGEYFGITTIINYKAIGEAIWAHNDFIEGLMSVGILGVGIYIITLFKILMNYRNYILLISLVLIGSFNGLMNYPILAIVTPLLVSFYCVFNGENSIEEQFDWKHSNQMIEKIIQKLSLRK